MKSSSSFFSFFFNSQVIAGLWVLSCVGSWCNFLTLFYICKESIQLQIHKSLYLLDIYLRSSSLRLLNNIFPFFLTAFVLLHTVPVLYEKYEDHIDPLAEKASAEFKKQYAVFDAKVLSKIPRGPLKDKKVA